MMVVLFTGLLVYLSESIPTAVSADNTIRVPEDYSSIQDAINAAADGDLVLVGPGVYKENLVIANKSIILASYYHLTANHNFISQTIIDGRGSNTITVEQTAGPQTRISGFTIQNGFDGISTDAVLEIDHNQITGNAHDGLDIEGGSCHCHDNIFENSLDDGIDIDRDTGGIFEDNIIRSNEDDGIEIRFHPYTGPTLKITIRNNVIDGNQEDGIQLIGYPGTPLRVLRIERNQITNNHMVGLGLMDNAESNEDYRAASLPDRIYLYNNTFANNQSTDAGGNVLTGGYAVTGGDNLIAINNIFANHATMALKQIDGGSVVAYSLFWNNAVDNLGSNVDASTSVYGDPLFIAGYRPLAGSPAIDAGTAHFMWNGQVVLDIPPAGYKGTAPDIGWYETNLNDSSYYLSILSNP